MSPTVSVVIVSRDRPHHLRLVLTALRYQSLPEFEVIVVSNQSGSDNISTKIETLNLIRIRFDAANVAAARNAGISAAAGDVIAFCDDDAIPEPPWLERLTAPFADPAVGAAGGFVRGRNGISYQWRARTVDGQGRHEDIVVPTTAILAPPAGQAIKTEGTNCAFRRSLLEALGGFDERFAFFADEADLNVRIARHGAATAIVPDAEVQHGFAAGPHRREDRVPRSLTEIGRAAALFAAKHGDPADWPAARAGFAAAMRSKLIGHMVDGAIEPGDVGRLMAEWNAGADDPRTDPLPAPDLSPPNRQLLPFRAPLATADNVLLAARPIYWRRARKEAQARAARGEAATLLRLTFTGLYHRSWFDRRGFWVQRGGVFGRSDRRQNLFELGALAGRARAEARRLARIRGVKSVKINGESVVAIDE